MQTVAPLFPDYSWQRRIGSAISSQRCTAAGVEFCMWGWEAVLNVLGFCFHVVTTGTGRTAWAAMSGTVDLVAFSVKAVAYSFHLFTSSVSEGNV